MKYVFVGKKIEITENLKDKICKKIDKLDKFFFEDSQAKVVLTKERERYIVEVTVHQKGLIFRAEDTNYELMSAVEKIVDILERKMRKNKTRLSKKVREDAYETYTFSPEIDAEESEEPLKIIKSKSFPVKPMNVEEAILQMNLLSHTFFVFKNDVDGRANVVYKRKNGGFGLIETEND